MEKSRTNFPMGLLFIAVFYTFGALVLLIFLFTNPSPTSSVIARVHGLPASTGNWILPFVAGLGLLIAYGLFSLSRWGYVLTIIYLGYFGFVSGSLFKTFNNAVYLGNLIWSIFVIVYLILIHKRFHMK